MHFKIVRVRVHVRVWPYPPLPLTRNIVSSQQQQQPILCAIDTSVTDIYFTSTFYLLIEMSYHDWSDLHMIGHYSGLTTESLHKYSL